MVALVEERLGAAGIIVSVAEPFADSLVSAGRQLHVNDFLLVQWVAPVASDTPEFIAVLLLAYRLHASAGLGALISSKINQWTILVGVLPLVFALSAGSWAMNNPGRLHTPAAVS